MKTVALTGKHTEPLHRALTGVKLRHAPRDTYLYHGTLYRVTETAQGADCVVLVCDGIPRGKVDADIVYLLGGGEVPEECACPVIAATPHSAGGINRLLAAIHTFCTGEAAPRRRRRTPPWVVLFGAVGALLLWYFFMKF